MRSFFRDQPGRHGRAARVLAIVFLALPLVSRSAEAEVPAPAQSPKDSLKAFESRAGRLAAEGLPQKTREERQKESTPIIPEDCTIEVVSWHPADPQKQTETAVYEVRGGVVTARLPNLKVPETKSESSRREGYEITRSFEGRLQGNTIVGTWVFEHSYQEWGWTNRGVTSHNIVKTVDTMPTRIELHRDGTITWEMSFEHVTQINRLIGEPPGLEVKRHSRTPDAGQQPGQGLWRFRPSSSTVVPAEGVPDEPTSSPSNLRPSASRFATEDPPGKFRLPPEKPSTRPLLTPKGQPSPTEEEELDDMPPFARRMFEALPAEKKAFFKKYHYNYGLGWQRSGNLLVWLSDTRLPMEELEVRAQLLLVTDHRYQQFYKTMVSTALGSAVDGAMWKLAAQALPATKYAELVKELATTPYELSTIAAEYREAADADRMLAKFVATYGKSEAEVIQDRSKTQDVIRFWNLRYQRTLADFEKARSEAPSAGEPLASDPEVRQKQQEATQKMLEAERTLRKIDGELRELDLEFKALTLRLKTIRGDWKPWIVHWEK